MASTTILPRPAGAFPAAHPVAPAGVPGPLLVITARCGDAAAQFAPALRWFAACGYELHWLTLACAGCADDQLTDPLPATVLRLGMRCSSLTQVPEPILRSYVDRAVELTGVGAILTYRRSNPDPQCRAVRAAVDHVALDHDLPVWIGPRDLSSTVEARAGSIRPLRVSRERLLLTA